MGHINVICKILSYLLGMKVCIYSEDLYIYSICKSVGPLFIKNMHISRTQVELTPSVRHWSNYVYLIIQTQTFCPFMDNLRK